MGRARKSAGGCAGCGPGMTRMSRSAGPGCGPGGAKTASAYGRARVARVLLGFLGRMTGALLVGTLASQPGSGCVLPPDLNPTAADAGPSSPPVVLSVAPADAFTPPGPIVISREDSPSMSLSTSDNDVGDFLYARLYRDYRQDAPTPALTDCQEPPDPTGKLVRLLTCDTNALCSSLPPEDSSNHVLEAMVTDRPFLLESDPEGEAQPPYRRVADFPRAGYSYVGWIMRCQSPQ
jgi:hypothetical protein